MASNPLKRVRGRLIFSLLFGCGGVGVLQGFLEKRVCKRGAFVVKTW